jgi:hypothetical protein
VIQPIEPIHNVPYYWVGPAYIIYDIRVPAHPSCTLNMRYYRVGQQYIIYDIAGWAQDIKYAILMGGPAICNM